MMTEWIYGIIYVSMLLLFTWRLFANAKKSAGKDKHSVLGLIVLWGVPAALYKFVVLDMIIGSYRMIGNLFFYASLLYMAIILFIVFPIYKHYLKEKRRKKEMEIERRKKRLADEEVAQAKKKANDDAISSQRILYAIDLKNKTKTTIEQCKKNNGEGKQKLSLLERQSFGLQEILWNVLNDLSVHILKLEHTIEKLQIKEDIE
jgi:hypothetical protein